MSPGGGSKSSQRCFVLQTHHKFKLLCREDKQQPQALKGNMKDTRIHPLGWARLTGGQRLHGEPGSGEERHVLQRTSPSTVLQVVLLKLRQRDETLHHPLVLNVNLRTHKKKNPPQHAQTWELRLVFWFTMLHLGLSGLLLASKWTSFLSNCVWSTYASLTI